MYIVQWLTNVRLNIKFYKTENTILLLSGANNVRLQIKQNKFIRQFTSSTTHFTSRRQKQFRGEKRTMNV